MNLDGAGYTYDNAGNRTAKTNYLNNITEQYTYDPIYQLTQVTQGITTTESYSYDAVGNRLSSLGMSPYVYNSSNELTSTPAATFTYDGNGNTLAKTGSNGTTTYNWDFENQLASVALPSSGGMVAFKYDPFGRRIQKSTSDGTTNYLYDGMNIIQELNINGNAVAGYTQRLGIDQPLAEMRSGTLAFYQQDALGSVTSLSNVTGTLVNTYSYDTFGNLTASTGSFDNLFQYTGREYDPETGLRYYRARYYDATNGKFLSEDPKGFAAGTNFYEYVSNVPTRMTDPLGLDGGDAPGVPVPVVPTPTWPIWINPNGLVKKPLSNLDMACGSDVGGACTLFQAALVLCSCQCDGGGQFKADPELRLYGTIYYYNGPFPYRGRRPKDRSVVDTQTAINREFNQHINPAINAVTPMITALRDKRFNSQDECIGECNKTSGLVNAQFKKTLADTQKQENRQ